jgi:hypothetical protein
MTVVREPTLKPVKIDELRPTQITVGMREVETKRKRWREKGSKKELKFLAVRFRSLRHLHLAIGPGGDGDGRRGSQSRVQVEAAKEEPANDERGKHSYQRSDVLNIAATARPSLVHWRTTAPS